MRECWRRGFCSSDQAGRANRLMLDEKPESALQRVRILFSVTRTGGMPPSSPARAARGGFTEWNHRRREWSRAPAGGGFCPSPASSFRPGASACFLFVVFAPVFPPAHQPFLLGYCLSRGISSRFMTRKAGLRRTAASGIRLCVSLVCVCFFTAYSFFISVYQLPAFSSRELMRPTSAWGSFR